MVGRSMSRTVESYDRNRSNRDIERPAIKPDTKRYKLTDRDALVLDLKLLCARNVLSYVVTRRDGSISVVRPPIIIADDYISFCTTDPLRDNSVNIRIDKIANIRARWPVDSAAASDA